MEAGRPSLTARGAAIHRAAHQVLEGGRIFADPLAVRILGAEAETEVGRAAREGPRRALRLFIAVRTRLAEDAFAAAFDGGVRQLVVLGAGLDTYAYRTRLGDGLRVFEVDHPATQAWKRRLLAEAAIAVPQSLTFVAVDFERTALADALRAAGFDAARPSFFFWLGVVPYLTEAAVFSTLGFIGGLAGGAHVVFDYANPPDEIADRADFAAAHDELAERVAAAGEAFRSYFRTDALHARLAELGLRRVEDLGPAGIRERFFPHRPGPARDAGGHIVHAATL